MPPAPFLVVDGPVLGLDLACIQCPAGVRVYWDLGAQDLRAKNHRTIPLPEDWVGALPTLADAKALPNASSVAWCLDGFLQLADPPPLPGLLAPHTHACAVQAALRTRTREWGSLLRLCLFDVFAEPAWAGEAGWPLADRATALESVVRTTIARTPDAPIAVARLRCYTAAHHHTLLATAHARGKSGLIIRSLEAGYHHDRPRLARVTAVASGVVVRTLARTLVVLDDAGFEANVRGPPNPVPLPGVGDRVFFAHHGITKTGAYRSPHYTATRFAQ